MTLLSSFLVSDLSALGTSGSQAEKSWKTLDPCQHQCCGCDPTLATHVFFIAQAHASSMASLLRAGPAGFLFTVPLRLLLGILRGK